MIDPNWNEQPMRESLTGKVWRKNEGFLPYVKAHHGVRSAEVQLLLGSGRVPKRQARRPALSWGGPSRGALRRLACEALAISFPLLTRLGH